MKKVDFGAYERFSRLYDYADTVQMQPLDSNLMPGVFSSAFGLPVSRFDQSDATLAGLAPIFKLPLPLTARFPLRQHNIFIKMFV
jgi:hypothetical protein